MSILSVIAYIECELCPADAEIELVEMANGTWGFDEDIELPEGWATEYEYGNIYSFYCGECAKEVGL